MDRLVKHIIAAIVLAFSTCTHADQTFTATDGSKVWIPDFALDMVALAQGTQDGVLRSFHVRDCTKGRGLTDVYELVLTGDGLSHRYVSRLTWSSKGTNVIDRVSIYACATALAKEGLLK